MAEKKDYTLRHNRPECIGCGVCAALAPQFWEMHADGKSDIIGSIKHPDTTEELQIDEKDMDINKQSAECCPVNVIHLEDNKTGKKII